MIVDSEIIKKKRIAILPLYYNCSLCDDEVVSSREVGPDVRYDHVIIQKTSGVKSPYGARSASTIINVCSKCFTEKVLPALEGIGCSVIEQKMMS